MSGLPDRQSGIDMPGMTSGVGTSNLLVAEAFRSALRHQLFIVAGIFLLLWLARLVAVNWGPAREMAGIRQPASAGPPASDPEPPGRRLLRISFGIMWIFDGILQAQPAMPVGLPSQVIEPSATSSPAWVRHLVTWGGTSWTNHPLQISAAVVWIQVGIGLWLLFARQGPWARFGALATVGWGLIVWIFGESFGGIFAPGLTWLFGAPGAALFYCAAGALLALPERAWHTPRLGRLILAGMGVFFVGMAVLQAWPGRGFWQGSVHGRPGTLTGMIRSMRQTPQPHYLARMVSAFADFVAAHGFAVNLFAVVALAVIGVAFLSGQPRLVRLGVGAGVVLCLADWALIEDLGFLGGLGTDPNSMIPMGLIFVSGYLAMTSVPAVPAREVAQAETPQSRPATPGPSIRNRLALLLQSGMHSLATASGRSVAAAGALGVTLLGVLPSAAASTNRNADPIIARATSASNYAAAAFTLTDQHGSQVSLASLRGKVVLLTFFDPVCSSGCAPIGRELAAVARLLAGDSAQVRLAAIVLSPAYRSLPVIQAFDRRDGLTRMPDWLCLTGTVAQLTKVWHAYGVTPQDRPGAAITLHNDIAYVIGRDGRIRQVIAANPGPGTAAWQSAFAAELADAARQSAS